MAPKKINYNIIIEPDQRTGNKKPCFTAYCPSFGLADDGDTIEEAMENIKKLIRFHLECLLEEGEKLNLKYNGKAMFATVQIPVPLC